MSKTIEARIVTKAGSLRPGTLVPATADIYVLVDDDSSPMQGWNDFATVVLTAFAEAVLRLSRRASKRETVRFMEGSFRVEIEASSDHEWTLELVAEEESDVGRRSRISRYSFADSICLASTEILDACRGHQYWTRDEEALQSVLSSLSSLRS